jgi:serine/threonine-protein kinase
VVVGVPALALSVLGAAHDTHPSRPIEAPIEDAETSRIGRMLGAYRLEAVIGRGAYAEVYRAIEPSTGRSAAIKILNPSFAKNPRAAERLRREAQILSGLSHPNLVSIGAFDVAEDGVPFLVMELLEGRTLLQVLAEGSIPAARAARLAAGIARGLAVAHGAGLVHRDLKPANLMIVRGVGGEEQVKILDFGIARALVAQEGVEAPLTLPGDLIGTPLYMAPEQILRPGSAGPAADLYALGGVLFHMLSGAPPFRGTVEAVLEQQMNHPAPPLAPALGLEHLVAELLHKDPTKRLGPAEDVLRVLEALGLIPTAPPVKREPDFEPRRETTEVKRLIPILLHARLALTSPLFWIGLGIGLLPALLMWLSR